MNAEQIVSIVVAILTGLAACIPLAVKLYQAVKEAVQEKNWTHLLGLVVDLMEEAETKFADGIQKTIQWYLDHKEWWETILSGEYQNYYEKMYGNR